MDTISLTTLKAAIDSFEERNLTEFKPKRAFYERVGINRIRFWQLVEGKKRPDVDEAHRLAEYFGKPLF
ncbi:hypothetical protein [Runella sp.]|uniref:hypothetical protein n=1 Tax=Runella sp. TaxID=1960881 RepID=UPI002603032F|nr:hypothetical protein [Runella sp.]